MPTKQKPIKIDQIKPGHPDYLQPDTQRLMILLDKGVSIDEAYKLVKGKDNIHVNTKTNIKQKYEKWQLSQPSIVKLAHKAVKDTLKMAEVIDTKGNVSIPSHTNRLAAASMVMDRVEPVVKVNHNLNINADVNPVDLSVYMSK